MRLLHTAVRQTDAHQLLCKACPACKMLLKVKLSLKDSGGVLQFCPFQELSNQCCNSNSFFCAQKPLSLLTADCLARFAIYDCKD